MIESAVCCREIQFTLVDCPGHASLIRTIIGGAQIIDLMLLVVDVTKGIQVPHCPPYSCFEAHMTLAESHACSGALLTQVHGLLRSPPVER